MKKEVIVLIFILSIGFISALHNVTTSNGQDSIYVVEGSAEYYNFSVENIGTSDIKQLNITLPEGLEFRDTTQITTAFFQSFSKVNNTLSWSNFAGSLIDVGETEYFSFVANATNAGNYQIIFLSTDSGGEYSSDIYFEVQSGCITNWTCTNWSTCLDNSQTRNCTDLNACGVSTGKPLEVKTCSIVNETIEGPCLSNWVCTNWTECIGGKEVRSCMDANSCGNTVGKPIEEQTCVGSGECSPIYSCADWEPEKCDKTQIQARICTDVNNCGIKDQTQEQRECKANSVLFFIILVIIIITITLFVTALLYLKIRSFSWKKEGLNNKKR